MTRAVALLRAVNVGGTGNVRMAELTAVLTEAGYGSVKTLLQSGNVVFTCKSSAGAKLEGELEALVAAAFRVRSAIVVRTASEWNALIANNPYPQAAADDPGRLVVMAFKSAPKPADVEALRAAIAGRETIHAIGKQLYMIYPDGQGNSKLTIALVERKLGCAGTARNWNTVLKLAAAVAALP